jgi:hypothetical protein
LVHRILQETRIAYVHAAHLDVDASLDEAADEILARLASGSASREEGEVPCAVVDEELRDGSAEPPKATRHNIGGFWVDMFADCVLPEPLDVCGSRPVLDGLIHRVQRLEPGDKDLVSPLGVLSLYGARQPL